MESLSAVSLQSEDVEVNIFFYKKLFFCHNPLVCSNFKDKIDSKATPSF
jgi:hypothetical protein